jgi:pimeloyl-ACP methyl ester carboxylesterase
MMRLKILFAGFAAGLAFLACCGSASAQLSAGRQENVRAGEATIHVTIRGQGEPIVFIPSFGRGAEDFDDLSRRLAPAGFQAIVPEPRGIGGSTGPMDVLTLHVEAADTAAVIQSLAGGRAIMLGHAHGNGVARMVAIQKSYFAEGNDASVWQSGWYLDVAAAQMAGAARTKLEEYWPGGSAPIFVLQATEDAMAVAENSRRLAAEFPDRVSVVQIAHSGHAMLPEQPELIATTIITQLRQ